MNEFEEVLKFPIIEKEVTYPGSLAPHRFLLSERKEKMKILDIGSGKAKSRNYFTSMGHEYVTLDNKEGIADVLADMHMIPFENETFDAILSTSAFQFSSNLVNAFTESYRVLKIGGTITGSIAFLEPWTWEGNIQASPSGVFLTLQEQGFTPQYIWPSWSVFEAIESAFKEVGIDEAILTSSIRTIENALQRLSKQRPRLQWEFAGALNFHAKK